MIPNPYDAPATTSDTSWLPYGSRVDGKYLVVSGNVTLPPRCIKTNQQVGLSEMAPVTVSHCSPLVGLLIVLSGFLLIFVYLLLRKKCTVTIGLSQAARKKLRFRRIANILVSIGLFFAIPIASISEALIVPLAVMLLFIGSIVTLIFGHRPIAAVKHINGEYWITGISKQYLAALEQT